MTTKNSTIFFITMLLISSVALAQPTAPRGKKWKKVEALSDEFERGFDTDKWTKSLWDYPGTPTKMIAANSGVSDGNLWLKATLDDNSQRWFQSSRVASKALIKYPMYTECSMITAHLSAYNTFWLNNGNITDRDEIDVVENNSRPSCGCQPNFPWQMNSQYFQVVNGDTKRNKGNFDNRNLSASNPKKGVKWNEEYHTVGVWWKDEKHMQFYLDGEPAGSVVSARDFTRDLKLIWDLWTDDVDWLGGVAVKNHLKDDKINTMKVDWVHTYELVDDNGNSGGGSSKSYTIKSVASKKWLSPKNGASKRGTEIVSHKEETGDARKWKLVYAGPDHVQIKNVKSGKCMVVPEGKSSNGVKITQWDCKDFQDQQWERIERGDGQFAFKNRKTGKCLDLTSGKTSHNTVIQQWECSLSNTNQRFWILNPPSARRLQAGTIAKEELSLYPNPVQDKLEIKNLTENTDKILIIDMQGKTILEQAVPANTRETVLNTTVLEEGIYIIKAGDKIQKFIKK